MIEQIEKIKSQYTDKYVVVDAQAPELARFRDLVGQVKTVNMSGRALVEFRDYNVNIGWFDIDLDDLKVVDQPPPATAKDDQKAAAKKSPAKPKAKAAATTGEKKLSPLELARQQGAGGGAKTEAKAKAASPETPAAGGEKKLSPLELARQQGAAGGAAKPTAKPAAKPAASEGEKKLSPLELARQQDSQRGESPPDPAPTESSSPAKETAEKSKPAGKMSTAEILAAARGDAGSSEAEAPPTEQPESAPEPVAAAAPEAAPAATDDGSPAERVDKSSMSIDEMLAYCREHDAE